jgi:hypothetical protein
MHIESIGLGLNYLFYFYAGTDEELMNKKVPLFEFEVAVPRKRKTLDLDLPRKRTC